MLKKQKRTSGDFTEAEVAQHWDDNADLWAEHVRQGWDSYREHLNNPAFLKFIGNLKGKTVLDAGCGEGYNTRIFARMGARMTGVDVSLRMIEHASREEQRESLGIRYETASFADLSGFDGESFDAVVSTMALMDGPDYEKAIAEIYRVLRKNSDFFFSISHPCFMTEGFGWVTDRENKQLLTVGGYFGKRHWMECWRFSQIPEEIRKDLPLFAIPRFPRTLSEYINPLLQTGFMLKKISEPRPSESDCRKYPYLRKWRDSGAIFLHVHCVKV
ncbi:MAG: methyltransferase domain-containing protein [Dehalococcoidales bacterium]|nr:methyltransferase domain-containing protein [Dehalococcoidales bacterium]